MLIAYRLSYNDMKTFYTEIVALSGSVFKGEVSQLKAPGLEGGFEILANHAPMLAAMGIGTLSVTTDAGDKVAYTTSGGFVQIQNNKAIVLAETAEALGEIDIERAKAAEARAKAEIESATTAAEKEAAKQALERSRNRLRAAIGKV